jgi:hypothetical protein
MFQYHKEPYRWNQVFLLVDRGDIRTISLLTDYLEGQGDQKHAVYITSGTHRNAIRIFLSDSFCLSLAFLWTKYTDEKDGAVPRCCLLPKGCSSLNLDLIIRLIRSSSTLREFSTPCWPQNRNTDSYLEDCSTKEMVVCSKEEVAASWQSQGARHSLLSKHDWHLDSGSGPRCFLWQSLH